VYVLTNGPDYNKLHQFISQETIQAVIDRKNDPSLFPTTEAVSNSLPLVGTLYEQCHRLQIPNQQLQYSSQSTNIPSTQTIMPSIPTSPTSLPTTLTTSNKLRIRSRRRHQTLLISTVKMNTLTTTPLSNTSSNQSKRIFRKSVFDKAEGDMLDTAAVDGPEIAVGAASKNAIVQAGRTVAAATAG
jgi:hypothetical protein